MRKALCAAAVVAVFGGTGLLASGAANAANADGVSAVRSAAAENCGAAPAIDLWYDSDQYGAYTKVSFNQTAAGCAGPRAIEVQVFCQEPALGTVYQERVQDAAGPVSFPTGALPDECQQFTAWGVTSTPGYDTEIKSEDSWSWSKGQFPA